ncbi:Copia protein, partial [Mucuna pruriens]
MTNGVCEMLWLKRVLEELKMLIHMPMKLYCDNKAAISIAQNPVQHNRTKHVEIDRHFIKEKIECGVICLPFFPSLQQITNIFTKGIHKPSFEMHVKHICSNLRGNDRFLGEIFVKTEEEHPKDISEPLFYSFQVNGSEKPRSRGAESTSEEELTLTSRYRFGQSKEIDHS